LNTYFPRIGEEFVKAGHAAVSLVGQAPSTLSSSRAVVDFATVFLSEALEDGEGYSLIWSRPNKRNAD
jgi:hypothetical protein